MKKTKPSSYDKFTMALRAIVSPDAKKAVDEDKKKRKSKKTSASSPASRDKG